MYQTHHPLRLQADKGILLLIVPIFLMSFMLFQLYPTFDSYFMADDFSWIDFVNSYSYAPDIVLQPSPGGWTTPLPNLIFWGLFKAFGPDPQGYYAANALFHLFNSLLVYRLIYLVTRRFEIAFGATFVFALHFAHFSDWGPLVWISAFVQLIVALFYLSSLILFIRYLQLKKAYYHAGALGCFVLAIASKETAISLPLLLLVWYMIIGQSRDKRRFTRAALLLGPFVTLLAAYLLYELAFQLSGNYLRQGTYGVGIHVVSNWKYFSNLVIPNPESPPVHNFLLRTFPTWVFSLSCSTAVIIRISLLVIGILLWLKGSIRVRIWIALSLITYLPFVGFAEGFAGPNRYFYLPAVGFSALVAEGLCWTFQRLVPRRGIAVALPGLAVVVLALWGYNLLPIRAWQKQMWTNSEVRREVLRMVDEHMAERGVKVYLKDFPDKFRDLTVATRALYGVDAIWVAPNNRDEIRPPANALILIYEADRVVMHQP